MKLVLKRVPPLEDEYVIGFTESLRNYADSLMERKEIHSWGFLRTDDNGDEWVGIQPLRGTAYDIFTREIAMNTAILHKVIL